MVDWLIAIILATIVFIFAFTLFYKWVSKK